MANEQRRKHQRRQQKSPSVPRNEAVQELAVRASGNFGIGALILAVFFSSGAFALVYQVCWVRAITLEFGSTTLAVSTVLTVFMGGLALGAWVAGNRIDNSKRPLTTYAVLELLLAGFTLLTPLLFEYLLPAVSQFAYSLSDGVVTVFLARFVAATLLLIVPTVLMGATLPILSRFWAMREADSGRWAGLLYGLNTVGAFAGTVAGAFYLLPSLGLSLTLYIVAGCNVGLAIIALLTGKALEREPAEARQPDAAAPPIPSTDATLCWRDNWPIYLAVMLTGFAALTCEVAWTRTLVLVLGASVFAFAIVLATFLAGLGLGSAAIAAFLRATPERARTVFYGLAIAAAFAVSITSAAFEHLPPLFVELYGSWNVDQNVDQVLRIQILLSAAVMILPSFIMGGLFPAAARIMVRDRATTGASVGRLYSWNTFGAILGSFAAGFVLIPWLGIRGTLLVAVAAQVIGGAAAVFHIDNRRLARSLTGGSLVTLALLLLLTPPWHKQLMASAVYRYADSYGGTTAGSLQAELEGGEEMLYYKDGLTATITVTHDLVSGSDDLYISTNGKIDGSSHYDMPTQRLVAHVPLLFHPDPKNVAIIGMGTGSTAGSAGLHPVDQVTVLEIEAAMVEGSRLFGAHNHDVHDNPRVDIRVTDGRLFLNQHDGAFDILISEPSNPWLAGVSDLFTREFFQRGARALREDGLFSQWVQLYSLSPENVKTIVRTFNSVFPYVYVISTIPDTDLLLLGSKIPFELDLVRAHNRMQQLEIKADLIDPRVDIDTVFQLAARVRIGPNEVKAFTGEGVLHTDDLPIIAYTAPKDLYRETREPNMISLAQHARGAGPYLDLTGLDSAGRARILRNLGRAYRAFMPQGREHTVCEEMAAALDAETVGAVE